jgi:hypothetical protein
VQSRYAEGEEDPSREALLRNLLSTAVQAQDVWWVRKLCQATNLRSGSALHRMRTRQALRALRQAGFQAGMYDALRSSL